MIYPPIMTSEREAIQFISRSGLVLDCFGAIAPRNADACYSRALVSGRDDFLALLAEAFDAERDDVADIEELRRLHAVRRRRAGCPW